MKELIENIYKQKNNFIIIGLTGKTGSGCTTISEILKNGYQDYNAKEDHSKPVQNRKNTIIKNFAQKNFVENKFEIIRPSTIIMILFIFEKSIFFAKIKSLMKLLENNDEKKIKEECENVLNLYKAFISFKQKNNLDNKSSFEKILNNLINNYNKENKNNLITYIKKKKEKYEERLLNQDLDGLTSEINSLFSSDFKKKDLKFKKIPYKKITPKKDIKAKVKNKFKLKRKIIKKILEKLSKKKGKKFIALYKNYDQDITKKRASEELSIPQLQIIGDLVREHIDIFQLPEYINLLIKSYRNESKKENKPCYIAIDSLKNPFEILFFKERYSAYYTFSIHAIDNTIYQRFLEKNINIKAIHKKELNQDNSDKQKSSLNSPKDFNSQNIIECIQRSDIYIDNNHDKKDTLYRQVFKYLSLIIHPGLITPTKDEMIMQLALNTKYNSGCISRQVGAVVLNKYDSVRAVGWNDVPEGQMPCLFRSHNELLNNPSSIDYSHYEKNTIRKTKQFKNIFTDKNNNQYVESNRKGLNDSFCFKQIQNELDDEKNQVYTRSLHAEENAFLQASKYGNTEIIGGQLFTTASPCFLCAKKAYQLGIKRIVYIEAYPDISKEQIFDTGKNKVVMIHFRGAIGLAYQKLYEPLFSYKDELKALNIKK